MRLKKKGPRIDAARMLSEIFRTNELSSNLRRLAHCEAKGKGEDSARLLA